MDIFQVYTYTNIKNVCVCVCGKNRGEERMYFPSYGIYDETLNEKGELECRTFSDT